MSEFLKYENLYLHYGNKLVLKNLSGALQSGHLYVLGGENGAGKTSLLNILSGHIIANKGKVSGPKYNRESIKALVGPHSLFSHLSIQENLEIFSDCKATDVLERFYIQDYSKTLIRDLSQGYVQRVSLAIALSSKAEVLILDEPTNFLDKVSKELLLSEFRNALGVGKAILLSSHEPNYFSCLAPTFLELRGGEYV